MARTWKEDGFTSHHSLWTWLGGVCCFVVEYHISMFYLTQTKHLSYPLFIYFCVFNMFHYTPHKDISALGPLVRISGRPLCPSVRLSVRPSARPSVTPFSLCSHHRTCIIMKFSGIIANDQDKVHAKGQGQRSKVKVTDVTTQLNRFRTVTPVWIHIWWWNDAYSLMLLRRGALLF